MHPFYLTKPVTIAGRTFRGRKAALVIAPLREKTPGIFWQRTKRQSPIPITLGLLRPELRRLTLISDESRLDYAEHLLALAWVGLDSVAFVTPNSRTPYYLSGEMFQAIRPSLTKDTTTTIPWYTIKERVTWSYQNRRGFVETLPHPRHQKPYLEVRVICDYPALGRGQLVYQIPYAFGPKLEEILIAPTLGLPPALRPLARLAGLCRWPHPGRIIWAKDQEAKTVLALALRHRLMDILGALALLDTTRRFAGSFISYCAGHEADYNILRLMKPLIAPLKD